MPEPDDNLTPARPEDLRACIAYALTSDGRLAKAQSAGVGVDRRRAPGAAALGRGFEG